MQCSEIQTSNEATLDFIICVASSVSWATYLGPIILLVSASVAFFGVLKARETARKKATLDLIEKVESSEHYRRRHSVFSYYRRQGGFGSLHNPKESKDTEDRHAVQDYLNHYELVSIGICRGILDKGFYKEWMLGPFVRDWNAASAYIQRERWKWDASSKEWQYRSRLYGNFQKIALDFSDDAINLVEDNKPPGKPRGPGDEALPSSGEDSGQN